MRVPVIIVTFRNPDDVEAALGGLAAAEPTPAFDVFICENGGADAFAAMTDRLTRPDGPLAAAPDLAPPVAGDFAQIASFRLKRSGARVHIGDAGENLGYGGGVNRWLGPLLKIDWPGVLILNPDAALAPDALARLSADAARRGKGMVTGRIILTDAPDRIQTRGLRWRPWLGSTEAVDRLAPADVKPDIEALERRLDAPSGALIYATRACIETVGLMREDYFLYFEDMDWGMRAKRACGLGYCFEAVAHHKGGTTIGSGSRAGGSAFSAFLDARNCLLFARSMTPLWWPWVIATTCARAAQYALLRRPDKARAALRGVADALRGRSGRPDAMLRAHFGRP